MEAEEFAKLAEFMGWKKEVMAIVPSIQWWEDASGKGRADIPGRTSFTDAEAIELLNRISERNDGFYWEMWSGRDMNKQAKIYGVDIGQPDWRNYDYAFPEDPDCVHSTAPTIPEAVAGAVLAMIKKQEQFN